MSHHVHEGVPFKILISLISMRAILLHFIKFGSNYQNKKKKPITRRLMVIVLFNDLAEFFPCFVLFYPTTLLYKLILVPILKGFSLFLLKDSHSYIIFSYRFFKHDKNFSLGYIQKKLQKFIACMFVITNHFCFIMGVVACNLKCVEIKLLYSSHVCVEDIKQVNAKNTEALTQPHKKFL